MAGESKPKSPVLSSLMLDTDYLVLAVSVNHPFAKKSMVTLPRFFSWKM